MPMNAMVLAAGLGTRLRPLTDHLPKALVPVLGVPMLSRLAAGLARGGVGALAINTHHLADQVQAHLSRPGALPPGLAVRVFHEPELLGTGGALVNAREFWGNQPLLVWNGDILADLSLAALALAHRQGGVLATLVVSERPSTSRLLVDGSGLLCGIDSPRRGTHRVVRTPQGAARPLAFHGVSLLGAALLPMLPPQGAFDLIDALLAAVERGGRIGVMDAGSALWGSTGSPVELAALEQALREQPDVLAHWTP